MAGLNRVTLLGNLGTDPETRRTAKQTAVCRFRLATTERRKDPEGNWEERPEWHNIVAFGKAAETCATFLRKGRQVYVEGKLRTRAWQDEEGQARHATEIVASNIQFLGGKEAGSDGRQLAGEPDTAFPDVSDQAVAMPGDDDDGIPF